MIFSVFTANNEVIQTWTVQTDHRRNKAEWNFSTAVKIYPTVIHLVPEAIIAINGPITTMNQGVTMIRDHTGLNLLTADTNALINIVKIPTHAPGIIRTIVINHQIGAHEMNHLTDTCETNHQTDTMLAIIHQTDTTLVINHRTETHVTDHHIGTHVTMHQMGFHAMIHLTVADHSKSPMIINEDHDQTNVQMVTIQTKDHLPDQLLPMIKCYHRGPVQIRL